MSIKVYFGHKKATVTGKTEGLIGSNNCADGANRLICKVNYMAQACLLIKL